MKNVFTLIALFLLLVNSVAQERVNGVKATFTAESGKLTSATGWAVNSADKDWVDYPNMISDNKDYKGKYKSLLNSSVTKSYCPQNFIEIQTKTLTYKDVKYFVLIVEKWSGEYEYPSIHEGYHEFLETIACAFTEEEYKKLVNLDKVVAIKSDIVVKQQSKYSTEAQLIEKIQREIGYTYRSSSYTFPVMKSTEGKIRFYIPQQFSSYNNYDFEKAYFETEPEKFNVILLK